MNNDKQYGLIYLSIRLFKLLAPVKKLLTISTIASVLSNASQMGLMGFGVLTLLYASGYIQTGSTVLYLLLTLLSVIGIIVGRFYEGYISHAGAYKLLADMRVKMFENIRRIAPACMSDDHKGDILSIAINDIETIEFFFAHVLGPLLTVILLPCICLTIASQIDVLFVYALLPIYLMISLIIPIISLKLGRNIGVRYRKRMAEYQVLVLETVYGLVDIQAFNFIKNRKEMLTAKSKEINRSNHELTFHRQLVTSLPSFFIYFARILIIGIASYIVLNRSINTAGVILLSYVVSASFSSSQSLTMVISSLLETYAAAQRIFRIEDTKEIVIEKKDASTLTKINEIKFNNLYFQYDKEGKAILKDLNLTIKKGEMIGIMGESGIGKSTLIRLLLRFWDPESGDILLDNKSIKSFTLNSLRNKIASLEQETLIFNGSIASNIALGKPEASFDEIQIAAKRVGIHDFIMSLSDGYETQMGEMNRQLSGGERQRVGIARIMLLDPDVIVMDEPTSSLDVLNEKLFLKTLSEEYLDKTIIIVSHRASTLCNCDRVFKLEDGHLIQTY